MAGNWRKAVGIAIEGGGLAVVLARVAMGYGG